ncbi:MBL fold metallo-hydrolase [Agitococcus lubricus]|uniref:Metallo-beta-lactamase superfamily protein n=1 Tax=Agitococcus lubricus TaxID=1077255 RepID=A0A2T5IZ18_9GAMM|nr:MBL fold metallo-hydrolase [Agitococcus lubricus]PTQ89206.1 metallo-beta-lactamase superfamily protein [Agitococcus lubricus]
MALKIHHLNCGTMCPHGAPLINGHGKITDHGHMVCHCLLIETKEGLVLVDTGLGIQDVRYPQQRLGHAFMAAVRPVADYRETAFIQIKELGFNPQDVRHILVTHLDLDHAGGLPDFPQAKVHVFAPEFRAAMNPNWREKLRYMPHQWSHGVNWVTYETEGETWHGFDSIRAIPDLEDEILLVPLVGHTRGHSGIAVNTHQGWLLHCGDAYFHHNQMKAEPSCPIGLEIFQRSLAMDNKARAHNLSRLQQLAQNTQGEIQLFSAHDSLEYARYQ